MRLIILSLAIMVAACEAQTDDIANEPDADALRVGKTAIARQPHADAGAADLAPAPLGLFPVATPSPSPTPAPMPDAGTDTTPPPDVIPPSPDAGTGVDAPPTIASCPWETVPILCGYPSVRSEYVAMRKDGRMCATCLKTQDSHEQIIGCWTSERSTCDPIRAPSTCSFLCVMRCDECVYAGATGDPCGRNDECISGSCASNSRCT